MICFELQQKSINEMRPVIDFTGCFSILAEYSVFICMVSLKNRQNSITRYRLTEENLVGNVKEPIQNYDLLSMVILCLGGEYMEDYGGVLKLLDVLLSPEAGIAEKRQILQDDFDIPMTETLEAEVQTMCNLSQGVEDMQSKAALFLIGTAPLFKYPDR